MTDLDPFIFSYGLDTKRQFEPLSDEQYALMRAELASLAVSTEKAEPLTEINEQVEGI